MCLPSRAPNNMARRLNFDFVTVDPTKRHFGLTSADRVKVRSRAAKNDPFSVPPHRRSKKGLAKKTPNVRILDETNLLSVSQIDPDSEHYHDVVTLQEQANCLSLISPPISPDDEGEEHDEGYFSRAVTQGFDDGQATPRPPKLQLDTRAPPIEDAAQITDRYKAQLVSILGVQHYPNAGRVDPFWTFPIEFKACLPAVLHHEMHHLTPVVPGLDFGEERNLLRWFAMGLYEPAHLYATLAFAAAHLLDTGSPLVTQEDVLHLKCSAIAAVNDALGKPDRRLKSSLIAAVICLAAFEFAFGETCSYNAHMEGGRRMISMRGGVQTMEPWICRMLKWLGGSSACWKIYWPYSRQMGLSDTLNRYNRAQVAERTMKGEPE